jgi:hypothetical protein
VLLKSAISSLGCVRRPKCSAALEAPLEVERTEDNLLVQLLEHPFSGFPLFGIRMMDDELHE